MAARHLSPLLFLLLLPALGQQTSIQTRINQRITQREEQISQVSAPPAPDVRAARLAALHHDASELSVLSISVQSDLQKLQQGMLVKDLHENLKKLEKLSKKVRREIE
jgi:hypothetical protein